MDRNNEFGNKIRALRKLAGLTQRELAEKVGIDFTYLSKIENGIMVPPSEETINKMSEVLKFAPDELLSMAKKFPKDLSPNQPEAIEFLRTIKDRELNKDDWAEIMKIAEKK